METDASWGATIAEDIGNQLGLGIDLLPNLLGAALALLFGWLLARAARGATQAVADTYNSFLSSLFPTGILSSARFSASVTRVFGELLFWSILFFAITVAARIAGLEAVSLWLDRITQHVPNLLVATAVVSMGYLLSLLVRQQFDTATPDDAESVADISLGKLLQTSVIAIALILALDQLGVDVILLIAITVVGVAAMAITFGVSFALGVRVYMANIIGVRTARARVRPGQTLRIDGAEGRLLEITSTQILLETDRGILLVPGRYFDERVTLVLSADREECFADD